MIGFVGLSHLGIVSSIAAAAKGFKTIGFDPDSSLTEKLNRFDLPIFEPGLLEELKSSKDNITFTSDASALKKCKVTYLSLDIKTDSENRSDLSGIQSHLENITKVLEPGSTLVILSQVPPGFTRRYLDACKNKGILLYYQVETLVFGNALERAMRPERYIVGCENPDEDLHETYKKFLQAYDCPVLPMRYESAELAKISINFCLVASITVANVLAGICEKVGADWKEIVPALRLDRRIGKYAYLDPGLGIAGGNLERDLVTIKDIAHNVGAESGLVDAWIQDSLYRKDWVLRLIHDRVLRKNSKAKIALWGLAYKPGTKSVKNSPATTLVDALKSCEILAYDPLVTYEASQLSQVSTPFSACENADALVIMTPWPEFSTLDLLSVRKALKGKIVIDPFSALSREKCLKLDLEYYSLGIGAQS